MRPSQIELLGLELNAVTHCNLSCVGCSHGSPVAQQSFVDPAEVRRDLATLAHVIHVREFRVVGGEPLLHPNLPQVLAEIRSSGIADTVRLISNGILMGRVALDWLPLVDEVHISSYPTKARAVLSTERLVHEARRFGVRVLLKEYKHFRAMLPTHPLSDDETSKVFRTCQQAHAWSCHVVTAGRLYICQAGLQAGGRDSYCELEPIVGLRTRIEQLLQRTLPIAQCKQCLGSLGNLIPHSQVARVTWREASGSGHIDYDHYEALERDPDADNGCSSEIVIS